jgi:hypothetical protein
VSELGLGEKLKNGRCKQVGRRMPVNLKSLGIAVSQDAKIGISFQRPGEINKISVGLSNKRSVGEPLADRFGNIEGSAALREFLHTPIRELDMNVVCHKLSV